MKLDDFDYHLPPERIAQTKCKPASDARFLIDDGKTIQDKRFHHLLDLLEKGDVLVINDTKVATAILDARKDSGSPMQVLLEREIAHNTYLCRIKGRNPRRGLELYFQKGLTGKIVQQDDDFFTIEFSDVFSEQYLKKYGRLPTPPYIKKKIPPKDYQTVYAEKLGSVAAPTAGLHFTPELITKLTEKGIEFAKVCLHIGAGTFLPIRTKNIADHKMHSERVLISPKDADLINQRKGKLFVVGTTALKALETLADEKRIIHAGEKDSDLFIYPGYHFKTHLDGFITNFHLPKSSLLLLVAALVGKERLMKDYQHAIENEYRFYSLGDAMLLINLHPTS